MKEKISNGFKKIRAYEYDLVTIPKSIEMLIDTTKRYKRTTLKQDVSKFPRRSLFRLHTEPVAKNTKNL